MKKPNPFVTVLLAVFTLGIYPMRKVAKAKKQASGALPTNPTAAPVIPTPSAHIDSIADSIPSTPQPMAPVTPPATPVAETPAAPEQPTTTPPVTPPLPPTPSV
jgi:hypothetical protein